MVEKGARKYFCNAYFSYFWSGIEPITITYKRLTRTDSLNIPNIFVTVGADAVFVNKVKRKHW